MNTSSYSWGTDQVRARVRVHLPHACRVRVRVRVRDQRGCRVGVRVGVRVRVSTLIVSAMSGGSDQ